MGVTTKLEPEPEDPVPQSFVIRLWPEKSARSNDEDPLWRGRIIHVGSGEARGVVCFHQLIGFIERQIGRKGSEHCLLCRFCRRVFGRGGA